MIKKSLISLPTSMEPKVSRNASTGTTILVRTVKESGSLTEVFSYVSTARVWLRPLSSNTGETLFPISATG